VVIYGEYDVLTLMALLYSLSEAVSGPQRGFRTVGEAFARWLTRSIALVLIST